jgi:hypothetical protein
MMELRGNGEQLCPAGGRVQNGSLPTASQWSFRDLEIEWSRARGNVGCA